MIRCIKCAQGTDFKLTNAIGEVITFKINEIGTAVVSASIDDVDRTLELTIPIEAALSAAQELEITCGKCEEIGDIVDLRTGFEDPLEHFETEHLCHCGGELWMDQIPGTRTYGFVCDKCNWVKPNAAVSGA